MTKTVSLCCFFDATYIPAPRNPEKPANIEQRSREVGGRVQKPGPKIQNHGSSPCFWISSHLSPFSKTMMKQCATKEIHPCLTCCDTIAGLCRKTLELRRCSRREMQCRLNGG